MTNAPLQNDYETKRKCALTKIFKKKWEREKKLTEQDIIIHNDSFGVWVGGSSVCSVCLFACCLFASLLACLFL